MPKRQTKREKNIQSLVEIGRVYSIDEAIATIKKLPGCKFVETVDVCVKLGVDARKSDQLVRGSTILPHGTGKKMRVAVFADGPAAKAAQDAGADIVGFEDLAEQVKAGQMGFDIVIATPEAMRVVGQLGQILGPRGLMPNPKVGTVTPDVATAVKNAKGGQIRYRSDKYGLIHTILGKVNFDSKKIRENLIALVSDLNKAKPSGAKGVYLRKIVLSTTMGPGLAIDSASLSA